MSEPDENSVRLWIVFTMEAPLTRPLANAIHASKSSGSLVGADISVLEGEDLVSVKLEDERLEGLEKNLGKENREMVGDKEENAHWWRKILISSRIRGLITFHKVLLNAKECSVTLLNGGEMTVNGTV
jgi:hypothetical protein